MKTFCINVLEVKRDVQGTPGNWDLRIPNLGVAGSNPAGIANTWLRSESLWQAALWAAYESSDFASPADSYGIALVARAARPAWQTKVGATCAMSIAHSYFQWCEAFHLFVIWDH